MSRAMEAVSTDAAIALIASLSRDRAEAVLLRVALGLDAQTAGQVLGRRAGAVRTAARRGPAFWPTCWSRGWRYPGGRRRGAAGCQISVGNAGEGFDAKGCDMSRARHPWIDAAAAERMLAGHGGGPQHLADLLSGAAGPARPGEAAAFRTARLSARQSSAGAERKRRRTAGPGVGEVAQGLCGSRRRAPARW
jgi:hypothetical protein